MTSDALIQSAPPQVSTEQATRIARELFGLDAVARPLGSNQDRNFLLTGAHGRSLLKIANPATTVAELTVQSRAAAHLADAEPGLRISRTRPGTAIRTVTIDGQELPATVLDFVEGATLSGSGHLAPGTLRAMGALSARVTLAFASFAPEGVERPSQWDLRRGPEVLATLLGSVPDPALRARLEQAGDQAWAALEPLGPTLALQTIHGDLTDDNVIAGPGHDRIPDGVIDFGDLNRSWAVAELAITLSSLLHHAGASITTAARALAAHHALRPLARPEALALWPLVLLRGAVLVASAHHIGADDPGNEYATANLAQEQAIFDRAGELPLAVATALVLRTVGQPLERPSLPPFRALLPALDPAQVTVLDLGATSPALDRGRWLGRDVEAELTGRALDAGSAAVITRFGESRLTRSAPLTSTPPANTALGVKISLRAGQDVVAPWPGTLTSAAGRLTLVGAGTRLELHGLRSPGTEASTVAAGDLIAAAETGFSIRVSSADPVPAFTTAALAPAWAALALDPTPLLLGAAHPEPRPGDGPRESADLLRRRHRSLADTQEHYYQEPPVMVRGWREHLIDAEGRVYLDMVNNVTSIGHAHPRMVEALSRQWSLLNTNSRFHYPAVVEFAERLGQLLPAGLDQVFLVNSGTEAADLALRISRAWSGREQVLAVREAYHGWSGLADAVSTSIADNPDALGTRPAWLHTLDAPNSYRGRHRGDAARGYAEDAVATVRALAAAGTPIGTFIAEAYYGNAGGMALPDGYLDAVYAAVRAGGGLCVADEVQVGYGRLGHWFWGFEQQGVVPDVVAVAKAMGNGHPLGAVVTTAEIAENYRSQGYFFSSTGGSPVSSVVGTTVLDVIRDERLQENARDTGGYLRDRLAGLGEQHPLIGAVHGSGLYLGVEFVRDRTTLEPATEETLAICERLLELGVIMQPTSDRQCVLKIKPPLCLTRQSADFFVAALDEVLSTGW